MGKLFDELKRRKVFRVAAVYTVVAWVLIQVADVVLPTFGAPAWVNQTLIFLFVIGFPLALVLAWAYESTPEGIKPEGAAQYAPAPVATSVQPINYLILVIVLLVAGFQVADRFLSDTEPPTLAAIDTDQSSGLTRVSVNIPEEEYFHSSRGDFDLSKDGKLFVYRGTDENGEPALWLRRWGELNGSLLIGTNDPNRPKISPNGEEVVYVGPNGVRVASLVGGFTRTLVARGEMGNGPADWSPDGEWIYFNNAQNGLSRIPASGGNVEPLTSVNNDNGEVQHDFVDVLPGNKITYTVELSDGNNIVRATDLETGVSKDLAAGKLPVYSNTGHVLFQAMDEPTLLAAPFDLETMEFTESAKPIATGLLQVGSGIAANVGVSNTGRLVYRLGTTIRQPGTPVWIDRSGRATEIDPEWTVFINDGAAGALTLSPSGDRLAISLPRPDRNDFDVWVKRLDEGPLSRITFSGEGNFYPAWSIDGRKLSYSMGTFGDGLSRWSKNADGSGIPELLLERPGFAVFQSTYSSDGRWLVFRQRLVNSRQFSGDIYAFDTSTNTEPTPLLVGEHYYHSFALSPDDQWLVYVSRESGRDEVFVCPFPACDAGRWQISSDGGTEPLWAHSGKELFYRNGANQLVAVQLSQGDSFAWDSQEVLFSMSGYRSSGLHHAYAVSPDDQRFVAIKLEAVEDSELILVDNWTELLE